MIVTGGVNCGEVWAVIALLELSEKGVRKFGRAETYRDDCGTQPPDSETDSLATTYRWFVKAGTTPVFYQEAFKKSCAANGKWLKADTLKQGILEHDRVEYIRLK